MALSYAHGAIQWLSADAATTTYTVSGLSFQPKAIRFFWVGLQSATDAASDAVNSRRGIGFATGTASRRCVGSFSQDTAATSNCGTVARNDAIAVTTDGAGATDGLLDLSSITSDGFVAIVDDAAPANITVFWEAWGGTDITAASVGDIAEPAATGTQNYTATGFTADGGGFQVVMFAGVQSIAAVNTAEAEASGLTVGYATGATTQNISVVGNADDASASMDTDGAARAGDCLMMIAKAGAATTTARAELTAFGTDQFTLNWTARAVTDRRNVYMVIRGGAWRAGGTTYTDTLSQTAVVSGLSFTPKGISLFGRNSSEQAAGAAATEDRMSFGCGSSTSSRRSMGTWDVDATASSACEIQTTLQYDQVLVYPQSSGTTIDAALDISAMAADGFTLIVDDASVVGGTKWVGYLAFGDGTAPAVGVLSGSTTIDFAPIATLTGTAPEMPILLVARRPMPRFDL